MTNRLAGLSRKGPNKRPYRASLQPASRLVSLCMLTRAQCCRRLSCMPAGVNSTNHDGHQLEGVTPAPRHDKWSVNAIKSELDDLATWQFEQPRLLQSRIVLCCQECCHHIWIVQPHLIVCNMNGICSSRLCSACSSCARLS